MNESLKENIQIRNLLHNVEMINIILEHTHQYINDMYTIIEDKVYSDDDFEGFQKYVTTNIINIVKDNLSILEKFM